MQAHELILPTEKDTLELGAKLATACPAKCMIFLQGELGAGKTTLVRGFLQSLGYQGLVKSPTYTLVETYHINDQTIFHFDLYRLTDPEELNYIGLEDYLNEPAAIIIIEWPEHGKNRLPPTDLTCYIETVSKGRRIRILANSILGQKIIQNIQV